MIEGPQVKLCAEWLHRLLGGYEPHVEAGQPEWKELAAALDGRRVLRAFCKGKHLFVEFQGERFLWNHLATEGRWRKLEPDKGLPHGAWLAFRLPRGTLCNLHGEKLGLLDEREVRARIGSIGIDVMTTPFPVDEIVDVIRSSVLPVGELLVEQAQISGIGDTARSEGLFLAQIDPRTPARELDEREARRLALSLHRVTLESYQAGGRWVLRVHNRAGKRCPTCGSEVLLLKQGTPARETFLCPHCQRFRCGEASITTVPATASTAGADAAPDEPPFRHRFAVGCAVWSYPGWVGSFYPPDASARDYLALYGERLTAVEANTTFYAIPTSETVARWAERLPPGFLFCPKLYRLVTHQGMLEKEIGVARQFVDHVLLLGDRLGPVFAQLPASYGPGRMADLEAFVTSWPHGEVPLVIELRHPAWFAAETRRCLLELLREHATGLVTLDSRPVHEVTWDPEVDPDRRKPLLPVQPAASSPHCFVRFVGHPNRARNKKYLEEWAATTAAWLAEGRNVTFFAHCPREEESPFLARDFHRTLLAQDVPVGELPWDSVRSGAMQPGLFDA